MSILVLFGGPAGAGKTTLAAAWCATRPRAVHLQLDEVRNLIVSGLADPQTGNREAVGAQYDLSVQACCGLASTFLAAGYDVAIDDVLEPDAYEQAWQPALADIEHRIVIVLPSLTATLERSKSRTKHVREHWTREQHAASTSWPDSLRLDTTGLTPDESLAVAKKRSLLP